MVASYYGIAHYTMGAIARPEGVLRGGAGRHRQPSRRDARRHRCSAWSKRSARATSATSPILEGSVGGGLRNGGNFVLFGSNYQDVFAFIVLILVLVFRPSGLLGERVGDRA